MPDINYRRGEGAVRALFPLTAALVLAADQATKLWMLSILFPERVIPLFGPLQLALVYNKGIAFGLFANQPYLSLAAFLALALFFFFYRAHLFYNLSSRLSIGLLLGGAVGNLVDRLRLGYVVDFVDLGFWPVFNLADSAVTVGVFLLAYSLYSSSRRQSVRG